jgi:hypothetical protein
MVRGTGWDVTAPEPRQGSRVVTGVEVTHVCTRFRAESLGEFALAGPQRVHHQRARPLRDPVRPIAHAQTNQEPRRIDAALRREADETPVALVPVERRDDELPNRRTECAPRAHSVRNFG